MLLRQLVLVKQEGERQAPKTKTGTRTDVDDMMIVASSETSGGK